MKRKLSSWVAHQLGRVLLDHTRIVMALAVLIAVAAGLVASRLQLDTSFSALLPANTPEVVEIDSLRERIGGTVELIVAVGGTETGRPRFARQLVKRLRRKPWIRRADAEFPVQFFLDRQLLLMPTEGLEQLQRALDDELTGVKARANPLYVDLEEDQDKTAPWELVDQRSRLAETSSLLKPYFTSADGRYLYVRVLPKGSTSEMAAGQRLLSKIKAVVAETRPDAYGVDIRYAGGLPLNQEQHHRMIEDLRRASLLALVLVLLLLSVYIRRVEAPFVLAIPLIFGLLVTFAVARLTVGHLNLVSGFLVSALIGLGIDFEIHLYLRYLEKLPDAGDARHAMRQAIEGTFPGCLTAALTTAAAFFAMTFARFRGYSEYGAIAGVGVLATLGMTYVTLPALALWLSRRRKGASHRLGRSPQRPLSRRLAWAMVLVGVGLTVVTLRLASQLRYRNDFKKLRGESPTVSFSDAVDQAFGGSLAPAAILVDNIAQARRVEDRLKLLRQDPSSGIQRSLSLAAMVPDVSERRTAVLKRMEQTLAALPRNDLAPDDRAHVDAALKQLRMPSWQTRDIPAAYLQQFLTLDGQSNLVLVWPRAGMHEDAEVIAWGDELSRFQKDLRAAGIPATILDENRIAARVLKQMKADAPRVLSYAAAALLLLLVVDFRRPRPVALVAGSLGLGIVWFLGLVHWFGFEINVFNQAVIPSLLGLGLDNAVHLQHRYNAEGPGSLPLVVSTTGSASLLASATTAIGFGAAVTARHYGVQSMGWVAIIGFTSAFVATTVFFPSVLCLLERPGAEPSAAASSNQAGTQPQ